MTVMISTSPRSRTRIGRCHLVLIVLDMVMAAAPSDRMEWLGAAVDQCCGLVKIKSCAQVALFDPVDTI
jgi:hypothetical protein